MRAVVDVVGLGNLWDTEVQMSNRCLYMKVLSLSSRGLGLIEAVVMSEMMHEKRRGLRMEL